MVPTCYRNFSLLSFGEEAEEDEEETMVVSKVSFGTSLLHTPLPPKRTKFNSPNNVQTSTSIGHRIVASNPGFLFRILSCSYETKSGAESLGSRLVGLSPAHLGAVKVLADGLKSVEIKGRGWVRCMI